MVIYLLSFHYFYEMCACAISSHINVISILLLSHHSYHSQYCETASRFYKITYDDSIYTHIQVFDSVLSESLLLLLHLDTFHNMVKLGLQILFLLIFYHMMHIYIGLHFQNLLHVLSIMIQQNLISHSLLCCTFYIYLCTSVLQHTHVHFGWSCKWQLLHI